MASRPEALTPLLVDPSPGSPSAEESHFTVVMHPSTGSALIQGLRAHRGLTPAPLGGTTLIDPSSSKTATRNPPYSCSVVRLFLLSNPVSLASPQMLVPRTLPNISLSGSASSETGPGPETQSCLLNCKSDHTAPLPARLRWLHPASREGPSRALSEACKGGGQYSAGTATPRGAGADTSTC